MQTIIVCHNIVEDVSMHHDTRGGGLCHSTTGVYAMACHNIMEGPSMHQRQSLAL